MKKLLFILICVLAAGLVHAQQDPHFTMYMFNKQAINPAYAGARETFSANALYRTQWTAFEGNPRTMTVGVHSPVGKVKKDFKRVALGLYAFSDKLGVSSFTGLYGQYAYRLPVSDNTKLSLALQTGFVFYSAKLSELEPGQVGDIALLQDIKSAFLPNIGFGSYLYGDNYYVGFSIPHLVQNQYDKDQIPVAGEAIARQYRHYFGMAGYAFDLSSALKLMPNILVKYVRNPGKEIAIPFDADFNLNAIFYDRLVLGLSYRLDDSFDALIEMQVTKNLGIGYAYDFTTSDLHKFDEGGTHEIMIQYDLGGPKLKTFTTPRFIRYD